jgi:hypothetical protein
VVLVYFLWNYFRERRDTLALMARISSEFTMAIKECCGNAARPS